MYIPDQLFRPEILDFPVATTRLGKTAYVNADHAATTPPFHCVEEDIESFLCSYGSVHRGAGVKSILSTDVYEESRQSILHAVNAPLDSYVLFSGNTTGAMNVAATFFAMLDGKVAVSSLEHSSSYLPWVVAEGRYVAHYEPTELQCLDEVNRAIQFYGQRQVVTYPIALDGTVDLAKFDAMFTQQRIKVVVLTAASNLTGACPDIRAIADITHRHNAYLVVDACQYIQHHQVDMADGIDFLAASGHKFYAPYGGGFLIGPKVFLDEFLPYQIGGGNLPYITTEGAFLRYQNQQAHDPGTPNALGAVAMASALEAIQSLGYDAIAEYERTLVTALYDGLADVPGIHLFAREFPSTTIPFIMDGVPAADVARRLNDEYGIGTRCGSFCVYRAVNELLGITPEQDAAIAADVRRGDTSTIPGIVRASLGLSNRMSDIDRLITAMCAIAGTCC